MVGVFIASGPFKAVEIIFSLCMPGLLLQDATRYVLINRGNNRGAFANDALYLLGQAVAIAALVVTAHVTVSTLILAWGIPAYVAMLLGWYQARLVPDIWASPGWLRDTRSYTIRYALEAVASQGGLQIVTFVLVGVAGIRASGSMRAAETVYKPTAVLTAGARTAFIPEFAHQRTEPTAIMGGVRRLATVLVAISTALGLPIVFLPDSVGRRVLGESWQSAEPLLIFVWLAQVGAVVGIAALIGLRALADPRRSFRAQMIALALQSAFGAIGAGLDGARGAVIGLAVASFVQAAWWWLYARAAAEEVSVLNKCAGTNPKSRVNSVLQTGDPPLASGEF